MTDHPVPPPERPAARAAESAPTCNAEREPLLEGDSQRVRCVLGRGHDGDHAGRTPDGTPVQWSSVPSAGDEPTRWCECEKRDPKAGGAWMDGVCVTCKLPREPEPAAAPPRETGDAGVLSPECPGCHRSMMLCPTSAGGQAFVCFNTSCNHLTVHLAGSVAPLPGTPGLEELVTSLREAIESARSSGRLMFATEIGWGRFEAKIARWEAALAALAARLSEAEGERDNAIMEAIELTITALDSQWGVPRQYQVIDYAGILAEAKKRAIARAAWGRDQ